MVNIYAPNLDKKKVAKELTAQQQISPREISIEETIESTFDRAFTVGTEQGRRLNLSSKINRELDKLLESTAKKFALDIASFGDQATMKEEYVKIKEANPEAGLKDVAEIEAEQLEDFNKIIKENETAVQEGSFLGSLIGYIGGFLADPAGLATLVFPAGVASGMKLIQALKVGATVEAAAAAGPLIANKPGEIEVRRQLGEEVSTGQVIAESAAEVGLAGVLGGAVGAATAKLLPLAAPAAKALKSKTKSALSFLEDAKHLEDAVPPGSTKEEHFQNLDKVFDDLSKGKDIDLEPPSPGYGAQEPIDEVSEITPEQLVRDAREILEETPDLSPESRVKFDELDSDELAFSRVKDCLLRG